MQKFPSVVNCASQLGIPEPSVTAGMRSVLILGAIAVLAVSASCREITVPAVDVFQVDVDPPSATVEIGATLRFTAIVRDDVGRELIRSITWSSSAPTVLEVPPRARRWPEAWAMRITATVEGRSGTANVTVCRGPVEGRSGGSVTLSATRGQSVVVTLVPQTTGNSTVQASITENGIVKSDSSVILVL